MNRKVLLLLVGILMGGIYLYSTYQVTPDGVSAIKGRMTSFLSVSPDVSRVEDSTQKVSPTAAGKSEVVSKEVQEYREAAYALADKIEKLGLDGEELNELFNRVGKENFLKHVPEEVRPQYLKLEEKVAALQKNYIKQDGMSERFFTKYQVQMPEWMDKHRKELDGVRLPSTVEQLVNKKINESEINNDEINEILAGCGKGNTSCINRAFALLIDAHHGLEDSQLRMIQEYL